MEQTLGADGQQLLHMLDTDASDALRDLPAVTEATLADQLALEAIAERQTARAILPRERYVDRGYMGGPGLVHADERHEDLIGPAPKDQSPQALRPDGISLKDFQIDLAQRTATCPQGHAGTPKTFVGERDSGDKGILFTFKRKDCHGCPL